MRIKGLVGKCFSTYTETKTHTHTNGLHPYSLQLHRFYLNTHHKAYVE